MFGRRSLLQLEDVHRIFQSHTQLTQVRVSDSHEEHRLHFLELVIDDVRISLGDAQQNVYELLIDGLYFFSEDRIAEELAMLFIFVAHHQLSEYFLHSGHVLKQGALGDEYLVVEAWQLGGFIDEAEQLSRHINNLRIHDFEHLPKTYHRRFQEIDRISWISLELDELLGLHIVVFAEQMKEFEHVTEYLQNVLFFFDLLVRVGFVYVLPDHPVLARVEEVVGVVGYDAEALIGYHFGFAHFEIVDDLPAHEHDQIVQLTQYPVVLTVLHLLQQGILAVSVPVHQEGYGHAEQLAGQLQLRLEFTIDDG